MATLDFTHESKTYLNFANDYQFCLFRQWIEDNYDPRMVQIERSRVYKDFTVEGTLKHAQGLGAELLGAKVNMFGRSSKGNPRNVPGDKIFVSPAGVAFEFIGRERDGFVELCHLEEGWTWFEPVDSFAERWVAG